jgi:hypothetical protein
MKNIDLTASPSKGWFVQAADTDILKSVFQDIRAVTITQGELTALRALHAEAAALKAAIGNRDLSSLIVAGDGLAGLLRWVEVE